MLSVRRVSTLTVDSTLPPREQSQLLARFARSERDELIRTGQSPASYRTLVDGQSGRTEDTVRPDGTIQYRFNLLGLAAAYALSYLVVHSPVGATGRYRTSWFIAINGAEWTGDLEDIPPNSEVTITNAAPYHRRIHVGNLRTIGVGLVDTVRSQVRRRFPQINANIAFVSLDGMIHGNRTPYILKHDHGRAGRRKGDPITYPACIITARLGLG